MRVTINLTKRTVTNDGRGITWLPDGTLSGDVTFEINEEKLVKLMGPRALRSKAKKSTLAGGAIVARVRNLERKAP